MKIRTRIQNLLVQYIPAKTGKYIGFLYGMGKKRTSYSQYGEDLILNSFIQRLNLKPGKILDIGAFHPVWYSNSYLLLKNGWTATIVDLDQSKIDRFKTVHKKKVDTLYAAVTPTSDIPVSKVISCYKFNKLYSVFDTISKETADHYQDQFNIQYTEEKVTSISINDIFTDRGPFDIINIDIEGIDELVLNDLNLNIHRPKIILFEDNTNFGGSQKVIKRLEQFGYRHLCTTGGTIIYFLEKLLQPIEAK